MTKRRQRYVSKFLFLDVEDGRDNLIERLKSEKSIPVTIHGRITSQFSHDDGVSIEFVVDVEEMEIDNG